MLKVQLVAIKFASISPVDLVVKFWFVLGIFEVFVQGNVLVTTDLLALYYQKTVNESFPSPPHTHKHRGITNSNSDHCVQKRRDN